MLETRYITCPYCGETFDTTVDLSAGDQDYVEDCRVCCRPIEFELRLDGHNGDFTLRPKRDDE